ncbi:MAG: sigma-54 dependent transcriptional regulator [Gemmatimonadota bacterium]|nr:sigma-54 dependent transcriptional regulator [Gemmatimonadota bacterium]
MNYGRILVVEDEESQRRALYGFLKKRGFYTVCGKSGEEALDILSSGLFDLVLTDQKMDQMSGLELLEKIKKDYPETQVIILTAFGDVRSAVQATKQGAYDYLTKPVDLEALEISITRALELRQLVNENRILRESLSKRHRFDNIISISGAMESVLNLAARVARVDTPVLITGESGTGKEMIAHAVHQAGKRKEKTFIAVNCAALNRNLIESELFGHEKGAFTGAIRQRQGKLETADQGTLFLDEIGEINPEIQVKLLRFLQEGTFERVGSDKTITAQVRLIAATNRDLDKALNDGILREDFYYRINVVNIHIPPLRSRREDIRPLVDHFLRANEGNLGHKSISREALGALLRYDFPGNIRELQNIIERAMILSRSEIIAREDLPPSVLSAAGQTEEQNGAQTALRGPLTEAVKNLEKEMIKNALAHSGGIQVKAAEKLGITERNLRYKMKKLGIYSGNG